MKHESSIHKRSREQRVAWEVLRSSPTVRMLAALSGPYWPHPTACQLAPVKAAGDALTDRQALFAEATRHQASAGRLSRVERREALLDDALDDSFPASDPPSIVAPVYGGWR